MGDFFKVSLFNKATGKSSDLYLEAGVTFENKNFSYKMDESGNFNVFDKNEKAVSESSKKQATTRKMELTDYQIRTIFAVADNNNDAEGKMVLSIEDIQQSLTQSKEDKLGDDLGTYLQNGYWVHNPKSFPDENKFSAYIKNGNETQSSVLAFKYTQKTNDYHDVKINNVSTGKKVTVKMEKGVSFENNGAIYRMNNDGLLSVYDKDENVWKAGLSEIKMTSYQMKAFEAVANNENDLKSSEHKNNLVLSKKDITTALEKFSQKQLAKDFQEFFNSSYVYQAKDFHAYSLKNAFSTYITNGNETQSAALVFKYGSAKDAVDMSDYVHNDVFGNEVKIVKNRGNNKKNTKNVKDLKLSNACLNLVKDCEKLKLTAYLCPAGVWTIGWGHTGGIRKGQKITKGKAEEFLKNDLGKVEKVIKKRVKVKLTQGQYDALVSFVFNVGETNFKDSTLLKCINEGDFEAANQQFDRWVYANNKKQGGLVIRRNKEQELFNK